MEHNYSTEDLEYPRCPLCQGDSLAIVYSNAYFDPHKVVRCNFCHFNFLSPRPTESQMLKFYQSQSYFADGREAGYANYQKQEVSLRMTFCRLMKNLQKRKLTGGSLLEVGCGYGYLLMEAGCYFDLREGTDFSENAVKHASAYADTVYHGGIEKVPSKKHYDLIVSNHVIEHVYDPVSFLKNLAKHLKRGGTMVISTPDMGSFWRKMMGIRWPSFKIPEHVLYFDKYGLRHVLSKAGLTNIHPLPYPHAFPLPLVASKFGINLPKIPSKFSIWIPQTTVAMTASAT